MALIFVVICVALMFEYMNGMNDTANAIAPVVSTKVLTPRQAVLLAVITNLMGALAGTAVAKTIASGLVDANVMSSSILVCALLGAILWQLTTWYFAMPSSSSHALIGGLCGSALAAAHGKWDVIVWSIPSSVHWWEGKGLLWKVIIPMVISPITGFALGFLLMGFLYLTLQRLRPTTINKSFGKLQIVSAAALGFMHGTNDAQKTMGIIALALLGGTKAGVLEGLPAWLRFLQAQEPPAGTTIEIDTWIKVVCALTMATGTAAGGWRIIKTLGHKMVRLQPIHGFAAQLSSASVIHVASLYGIPISTTHNISASILGVGAAKRLNAINWTVVERMVWAWVLTIPATALLAYCIVQFLRLIGILSS
jgi:PiT family inorganic phosphate transporter